MLMTLKQSAERDCFLLLLSHLFLFRLFPSMILQKVHVSSFRFSGWRAISSFSNDHSKRFCLWEITELISILCVASTLALAASHVRSRFTQMYRVCYLKKVVSLTILLFFPALFLFVSVSVLVKLNKASIR